jgi:hypothetical protein
MPNSLRLRIVFQGSVPKEDAPDAPNEDQIAADEARQRFAVCDGASESYDSARWSRLLADAWVVGGAAVSRNGLRTIVRRYDAACDPNSLSWSKRAAFDRGSFATVLGISLHGNRVRVFAVGDSIAVHVASSGTVATFPYTRGEEFDQRPLLFSTSSAANEGMLDEATFDLFIANWRLESGGNLLLMTDALGQWLLRRDADTASCTALLAVRTVEELRSFVDRERSSGAMRRDDTTLVHLRAEVP